MSEVEPKQTATEMTPENYVQNQVQKLVDSVNTQFPLLNKVLRSPTLDEKEQKEIEDIMIRTLRENSEIANLEEQWKPVADRMLKTFEDRLKYALRGDMDKSITDNFVPVSDDEFELIRKSVMHDGKRMLEEYDIAVQSNAGDPFYRAIQRSRWGTMQSAERTSEEESSWIENIIDMVIPFDEIYDMVNATVNANVRRDDRAEAIEAAENMGKTAYIDYVSGAVLGKLFKIIWNKCPENLRDKLIAKTDKIRAVLLKKIEECMRKRSAQLAEPVVDNSNRVAKNISEKPSSDTAISQIKNESGVVDIEIDFSPKKKDWKPKTWKPSKEMDHYRHIIGQPFGHGSNSGSLVGVARDKSLRPTGDLIREGLPPFSGELSNGISKNGVNQKGVSFSYAGYADINYAYGKETARGSNTVGWSVAGSKKKVEEIKKSLGELRRSGNQFDSELYETMLSKYNNQIRIEIMRQQQFEKLSEIERRLIQEPFPVCYRIGPEIEKPGATRRIHVPYNGNDGELYIEGELKLGENIKAILVPEEKIDLTKMYLQSKGIDTESVHVLPIELAVN